MRIKVYKKGNNIKQFDLAFLDNLFPAVYVEYYIL